MSTEASLARREGQAPSDAAREAGSGTGLHAFLDELLIEQQRLDTPVARFARSEHPKPPRDRPSPFHRDLIPLTAPDVGEQYAFEIDLDACSGCKACVAGCHSLNGLDEHETWRDVGLVLGGDATRPFQQTITTACHHCADPACANGCPVLAYEKDPRTGIVRHLDDQCIGCQYCVMKCPYDAPKYNARLGIVRKCDMCHGRLAAGEAPACVQACPTHAIRITKVATPASARRSGLESRFLPVFPDPDYTQPTTGYFTKRALPADLRAADAGALRSQPPHWPLVWMLVLTQLSVGALVAYAVTSLAGGSSGALLMVAGTTGLAGIAASVAHLGQPWRAWRVFLGLRKSWLSREAAVFSMYLALLGAAFVLRHPTFLTLVSAAGLAGVFCSAMIYADTRRTLWSAPRSLGNFFGTTAMLGLATAACVTSPVLPLLMAAAAVKLVGEAVFLVRNVRRGSSALVAVAGKDRDDVLSARLMLGPLQRTVRMRFFLGGLGGLILPALALVHPAGAWGCSIIAVAALIGGEMAERSLYFRAVVAPKMPGMSAS